jgi:hypothetical protein
LAPSLAARAGTDALFRAGTAFAAPAGEWHARGEDADRIFRRCQIDPPFPALPPRWPLRNPLTQTSPDKALSDGVLKSTHPCFHPLYGKSSRLKGGSISAERRSLAAPGARWGSSPSLTVSDGADQIQLRTPGWHLSACDIFAALRYCS